jgi:hypothetical protein
MVREDCAARALLTGQFVQPAANLRVRAGSLVGLTVGLTGFEPATPCPSTAAATDLSSFAETCADLRKHLGAEILLLLGRDLKSGPVTEYLGNKRGTPDAPHNRSDDDPNHQDSAARQNARQP